MVDAVKINLARDPQLNTYVEILARPEVESIAGWAEDLGYPLTSWQRSMIEAFYDGPPPRSFGTPRRNAVSQAIAEVHRTLDDVCESMQALRRLRTRYLHSLYRQRCLARRRRNR